MVAKNNAAPQKKCPECGQSVHVRTLVCPHCGHKFVKSSDKAQAPATASPAKQEAPMPVISRDRWKEFLTNEKKQLEEQQQIIQQRVAAIDTLINAG